MQDCFVYPAGLLRNPLPSPWASSANQNKKISLESKLSDEILFLVCDPCRIQTCNPHIRSVVLYSVELMDPCSIKTTRDKRESLAVRTRLELATSMMLVFAFSVSPPAVRTRLELATYGVTGRYSNQLNYRTKVLYATCVRTLLFFKSGCKSTAFF